MNGLVANERELEFDKNDLDHATPKRIFAIARAFINGKSIQHVQKKTLIDPFFLEKVQNIVLTQKELSTNTNKKLLV